MSDLKRMVLYVAHPLTPTDAEIRAIGVPSDGATEFTLRALATADNIERAKRWLAWLRIAFQETTFIAPWIANLWAYGDGAYIAAFERGGVDAGAVVERCDGIVLCGARITAGMLREAEHVFARDLELPPFRAWDLTCATEPEPPAFQPGRSFSSWAVMNRHALAALARGTVAVIAGGAILYALARYLGWWSIPLVLAGAVWERVRWTDGVGRFR